MAVSDFIKNLRNKTGSVSFSESEYSKIDHYIDTGIMALNRIISGSVYGGIPSGRTIVFAGPPSVGKSLISMSTAGNALNKNKYNTVIFFDSEGGANEDMAKNAGVIDTSLIEHILVESAEDATTKILQTYELLKAQKEKDKDFKALLILDSLGGLVPTKVYTDAQKDKQVQDQGNRARLLNTMVKACMIPAVKTNSSIIFLNHVYESPGEMYVSKIKDQSGGLGSQYVSTVNIQCEKLYVKPEKDEEADTFYKGNRLSFITCKNRLVCPFYEAQINLDFNNGFFRYDGLFDAAVEYGYIQTPTQGYFIVPSYSDTKLRKSEIMTNEKIWETFIGEFDKTSQEKMKYSKVSSSGPVKSNEEIKLQA